MFCTDITIKRHTQWDELEFELSSITAPASTLVWGEVLVLALLFTEVELAVTEGVESSPTCTLGVLFCRVGLVFCGKLDIKHGSPPVPHIPY